MRSSSQVVLKLTGLCGLIVLAGKVGKLFLNQDLEGLEAFCCLYVVYGELKMCMHANFEVLNVFFFLNALLLR